MTFKFSLSSTDDFTANGMSRFTIGSVCFLATKISSIKIVVLYYIKLRTTDVQNSFE